MSPQTAALVPLVLVGVAFAAYCLVDLVRAEEVRYLPPVVWGFLIVCSIPFGGIAYLMIGRVR